MHHFVFMATLTTVLVSACTSINSTGSNARYENLEFSSKSLQAVKPGDRLQLEIDGSIVRIRVTAYEGGTELAGIDEFSKKQVIIDFSDDGNIKTTEATGKTEEAFKGGETKSSTYEETPSDNGVLETLYWGLFVGAATITSPVWVPYQQGKEEKSRKIKMILKEENETYDGMSTSQIEDKLGQPIEKYICNDGRTRYYTVWQYNDKRLPGGLKYFRFNSENIELENNKLRVINDDLSLFGCCINLKYINKLADLSPDEICAISSELQNLDYAQDALERDDLEAAYRLIEDGIVSDYDEVRITSSQFINKHNNILQGARETFTSRALKQSAETYGKDAKKIEHKRLTIYKVVAPMKNYQEAQTNYNNVFGP